MSDADLVARVLSGRYVLERLLGRGGMSSVYLARDLRQERQVAVKVLEPELSGSLTGERFLREIGVAAKLAHPNVLPLHDSGEDGGLLYYVMPYVEGETLRDRLDREGALPLDEVLRLARELADALDYAHGQQILHRDIKPENVLLEQGHAVLADFGIARALGSAAGERLTATGMSLGTPAYMSPEQSTGESRLDARSDIYSLACVVYEMLAGEPAFTGATTQSIIAKRLAGPPPKVRTVRPSVPEHVERAILCAMDLTPADRFASAGAFAGALVADGERRRQPLRRFLASRRGRMVAVMLVALSGALAWTMSDRTTASERLPPTVAVLPLRNESSDAEHAYLAEGLTDAIIQDLARARGLRVVSRASVMQATGATMPMTGSASSMTRKAMTGPMPGGMSFMESPVRGAATTGREPASAAPMRKQPSLGELSRALRADVVMQGSFARTGDTVRVVASLVRAPSLEQVWRRSFTRHVRDLVTLQRDVVAAVAGGIESNDGEPAALHADAEREYAPQAHEAYLKGAYYQAHWKLPQAVAAFARAVELDPTHAPAQAGLSRAYYFLSFFGKLPPSVAVAGMRRAASAALGQDSTLAEAHGQMALVKMLQDWDWEGAERHFRRAVELSPGHAQIRHDYAHFLLGQGRQRESAQQTREALGFDPANPMLISCLGWHQLFDGHYAEAHQYAADAIAMMPDQWAYVIQGWALLGEGKRDSALAAFRSARRLEESGFTLAALGHALAVTGRAAEARTMLDSLLKLGQREYVSPYDIATVYAGLGARDEAFQWLRRAADERSTFIVHVGWDARFDAVRSDARFLELAERQLHLPTPRFAALTAESRRGF